jgi:hypothetical protein
VAVALDVVHVDDRNIFKFENCGLIIAVMGSDFRRVLDVFKREQLIFFMQIEGSKLSQDFSFRIP